MAIPPPTALKFLSILFIHVNTRPHCKYTPSLPFILSPSKDHPTACHCEERSGVAIPPPTNYPDARQQSMTLMASGDP